ncbi:MAG: M48 family metallopeptidase [Rhizobiales bacterium]|nr:M48 family metallopeptidase [Hyphomicrobiales bacterium]NRB15945.1 M48 family metallopeptidase [Hyphomicrobiales bacterium]
MPKFLAPKPKTNRSFFIELDGKNVEIFPKLNQRAKRLILRQNSMADGFKLTMPPRVSLAQAKRFCHQHASWMSGRLAAQGQLTCFAHGQFIPLRGQQYQLVFLDKLRGITEIHQNQIWVTGGADFAPRRLVNWLKQQAKTDIQIAINKYEPLLDVKHSRLTIRDTKSRWGSCSSSKALSFSWRLVMAPPDVLDYVVAHELAHILEMNHSAKFWQHVSAVCSHRAVSQKWLKLNGGQLHQIRVK